MTKVYAWNKNEVSEAKCNISRDIWRKSPKWFIEDNSYTELSPLPFQTTTASNDLWLGWIWCIAFLLLLVPLKHKKRLNQLQADYPGSRKARNQLHYYNIKITLNISNVLTRESIILQETNQKINREEDP